MKTDPPAPIPSDPREDFQQINQQLQELAELKNAFIALVSHELRTPMNVLAGYLELGLEEIEHDPDSAKKFFLRADENARRMMRVVQELTDFARLQRGKEITFQDPITLEVAFRQTYQLLKPNLQKKDIQLDVRIPRIVRRLQFDGESLVIIFRNVLSNAAKFSPQGAQVIVEGKQTAENVMLAVHDRAAPIPENKQETIFEDFRQLENYLTRRYEGMGLGLAVARRTARLLGGDIHLTVRDQGNTFYILLPLTADG